MPIQYIGDTIQEMKISR